jgi:hypothetical protein
MEIDNEKLICITSTEVGSIICYEFSKKLYLVAGLSRNGKVESRFLFSHTQNYNSSINNFKVYELIKGSGELVKPGADQVFEKRYNDLVKGRFKYDKNVLYEELYEEAQRKLKSISN